MGLGHPLDADTFALWRLNEATLGNYTSIVDSVGGFNLTPANAPPIVNSINNTRFARHFNGTSQRATRTASAGAVAGLLNDLTVQAKIRPDVLGVIQYVIAYGNALTDTTTANNHLLGFYIDTTNKLGSFTESGAGVNANILQPNAAGIVAGTWYDVAMVRTISGANQLVEFFVNGVSQGAAVSGVKPSGGTGATFWALGDGANASQYFNGAIGPVHISTVARSAAYIAADAARSDGKYTADASSLAYWSMDEAPDAIDDGPHGLHLMASIPANLVPAVDSLNGDLGYAKYFTSTTGGCELTSPPPPDPSAAALRTMMMTSEWTWEAWIRLGDTSAVRRWLFTWGAPGASDTAADNFYGLDIDFPTRDLIGYSESGAGVDATYNFGPFCTAAQAPHAQHVALRKKGLGATYTFEAFRNGVLIGTSGPLTQMTGGTNNFMRLASTSFGFGWYGLMDDVRLSSVARTDNEILSSYLLGSFSAVYRMRGLVSGVPVYWNALDVDSDASDYLGGGTVTDIVCVGVT